MGLRVARMRETKLILVEGLPGSGKSTTAHALARHLTRLGVPIRWWYEEEVGHPVYVFQNLDSLRQVVDDLNQGRYGAVVAAALDQWRRFAAMLAASGEVGLIDSCLFGYLTWTLFPHDRPEAEILAYVAEVERIVAPLNPCLIYFRQEDVARSLRRLVDRRGGSTETLFIQKGTQSTYGRHHRLEGFDGMVAYWTAYRQVTDTAFARSALWKVAIDTTLGDWPAYRQQVLAFLDLAPLAEAAVPADVLQRFVGRYAYAEREAQSSVTVSLEAGSLVLDGLPQVWPRTRLVPTSASTFAVESLPFEARFEEDGRGAVVRMVISGPALLGGRPPAILTKR
jgi:hypothetical protein